MTPEETVAMMREQLGFLRTQIRVLEEQIRSRDRQLDQLQAAYDRSLGITSREQAFTCQPPESSSVPHQYDDETSGWDAPPGTI